jgi:hypothetical protein
VKPVEQGVQSEGSGAAGIDLRTGAAVGVDGVHRQPGLTRDPTLADRCRGVQLGLAAGDRNGGPTELAVRLAESLAERRAFDRDDVLARYLAWWRDGAFDTGPVAALVLERVACGVPVAKAVAQADRELGGQTAGCNPAHRAGPLAMAAFLDDAIVGDCALRSATTRSRHARLASRQVSTARSPRLRRCLDGATRDALHTRLRDCGIMIPLSLVRYARALRLLGTLRLGLRPFVAQREKLVTTTPVGVP